MKVPKERKERLFNELDAMGFKIAGIARRIGVNPQRLRVAKMDKNDLDLDTYDKIESIIRINRAYDEQR